MEAAAARGARGRTPAASGVLSAFFLSTPLRVVLQIGSVFVFVVTLATALLGTTTELLNFAPTFVYVIFWLGVPLLSVLFGNVWRALSPWRAIADGAVWVLELGGREARPVLQWSGPLGAVSGGRRALLLRRARARRIRGRPTRERSRSRSALYSYWALAGMAVYGREAWSRGGEGFAVMFQLFSRIAPFAVRDGATSSCAGPSPGSAGSERVRGSAGVRRRDDRLDELRRLLAHDHVAETSSATSARISPDSSLAHDRSRHDRHERRGAGVIRHSGGAHVPRLRSVRGSRARTRRRSLVPDFVFPLVPIAAAYMVAHYFSYFLIQGQFIITLASDPFGRGWNLFGTADFAPNLAIVAPDTVWYVAGRGSRRRPRRRSRDRARPRGDDVRGSARRLCARSIRCSR